MYVSAEAPDGAAHRRVSGKYAELVMAAEATEAGLAAAVDWANAGMAIEKALSVFQTTKYLIRLAVCKGNIFRMIAELLGGKSTS
jgi:hypothetical protein